MDNVEQQQVFMTHFPATTPYAEHSFEEIAAAFGDMTAEEAEIIFLEGMQKARGICEANEGLMYIVAGELHSRRSNTYDRSAYRDRYNDSEEAA